MRHAAAHHSDDPDVVRDLVGEFPWAVLISSTPDGPVASHYPVLLEDPPAGSLSLVTHVGRPDETLHQFGDREVLVIVQGRHGYVSPSWYVPGASGAPTWNFTAAHLYGRPEVLGPEENLAVLTRLVAHFEQHVDDPMWLDQEWGAKAARGTVGLRIPVERFVLKVKMSQDKDPVSVQNVIDALRRPGPYHHPRLAEDMETARDR